MSTHKHIDRICIAVLILALLLTFLIMRTAGQETYSGEHTLGYENRLFNTSSVHSLDIVLQDFDSFLSTCENEEYVDCTVLIDGEKYSHVALRAKGNTSLTNVRSMGSQRYSFKLEFDHYDSNKTYYGLDKLCLNNLIQDNTLMKDYLVYQMMDAFDVDAPLSSYVYITVNGEDWGLYLAVEGIEDSFLKRNYGTDAGELYKPDSTGFGGGKGNGQRFNMDDLENEEDTAFVPQGPEEPQAEKPEPFSSSEEKAPRGDFEGGMGPGGMEDFQNPSMEQRDRGFGGMGSDDVKLKYIDDDPDSYANIFGNAKTDITEEDKERLITALQNLSLYTNLEDTLDLEEVLRYFVVHNFVVNGDSYTGSMIHNYYLHEKEGQLSMIPWDYNLAFGTFTGGSASSSINESIDSPVSGGNVDDRPMVGWIFSNEEYTKAYHTLFSEFRTEWIGEGRLQNLITQTADLIRPYVQKDPTKFCTSEDFEKGVSTLIEYVALRGEAVEKQLSGDMTPVDADGINTSDLGSMGGMGGREDRRDLQQKVLTEGQNEESREKGSMSPQGFAPPESPADAPMGQPPAGMNGPGNPMAFPDQESAETKDPGFQPADPGFENGPGLQMNEDWQPEPMEEIPHAEPTSPQSPESTLLWIGLSILTLLAGLGIAVTKKYGSWDL